METLLDLDALFEEEPPCSPEVVEEFPEGILRDVSAIEIRTWGTTPAFQLVLCFRGEPQAVVWSDGRWSPVQQWRAVDRNGYPEAPGVRWKPLDTLMETLSLAAACYFGLDEDESDHALDLLVSGLADGAHNGLAAGLLYRQVSGEGCVGDEDEE